MPSLTQWTRTNLTASRQSITQTTCRCGCIKSAQVQHRTIPLLWRGVTPLDRMVTAKFCLPRFVQYVMASYKVKGNYIHNPHLTKKSFLTVLREQQKKYY